MNSAIDNIKRVKRVLFLENAKKLSRLARVVQNYPEFQRRKRQIEDYQTNKFAAEIRSLNTNGYSRFEPSTGPADRLVEHAHRRFDEVTESDMVIQEGKKYYKNSLRPDDYEPSTPFMQYALDENTLRAVGGYLGCAPFIQSIELIYSTPSEPRETLYRTHLYHKDLIDKKIVKFFTYITDVDSTCGPLTVLPHTMMENAPWYLNKVPGFVTDEELSHYVDLSEAVGFTGSAGSAMMVDTRKLFHYGSRCERPRLTFVVHYNSGFAYYPRNEFHDRWRNNGVDYGLSNLQAWALGFD